MADQRDPNFRELRIDYGDAELRRRDLPEDPLAFFRRWLDEATEAGVREPNAMALATCDGDGQPHCRIVLLKQLDAQGFGFFTNKQSDKGAQLRQNQRAAVTFCWPAPRTRQVRIEGSMVELPESVSDAYFQSRPRRAQLCSAASPQSAVVKDREALEGLVDALEQQVGDGEVRRPERWGGYALRPERIEFWQGRDGRLHDRFRFQLAGTGWLLDRLAP
ncbi:MAG: pyridoxamine 5'-phosphate oxidase [Planctomycetota bacterium]